MLNSPERRAYLLLAAVVLLWGVNWPLMKFGLAYITPLWFATFRVSSGAATLFLLLGLGGRLRLPRRGELAVLVSVGAFQVGLNLALVHTGVQFIAAGRSVIIAYTTPLWAAPLAVLFLGERIGPRKVLGLALGLAGIAVLFAPGTVDFTDPGVMLGNGMLLLASLISAAAIVHVRACGPSLRALDLAPWQLLLGGAVVLPIAVVAEGAPVAQWSPTLLVVIAYNGVLATALALWAFVVVMRDLPATSTSIGSLGVPVVGVVVSAILLGEALTVSEMLGLALILAGVVAVTTSDLGRRRA